MKLGGESREHWGQGLVCSATGLEAPLDEPGFLSPAGKPWLVSYELDRRRGESLARSLRHRPWTLWRYRELLPVSRFHARVDLGEGGTPVVRLQRAGPDGVSVFVKNEAGNPTGSFKDRGLSLAVNRARELGAPGVQLPSAGNAGVSAAAYAAAAGLPCRVALPEDTPATVAERCRAFGAEVVESGGTLVDAGAALQERGGGLWDLSTLREPYRVEGKKTMGFEVAEQFGWRLPDWIVYPTGGGTGIVGMAKAFAELRRLGLLSGPPAKFAVVQMAGCAPIVRAFRDGSEQAEPWDAPETRVWGLRVPRAIGDFLVLRAVRESGGTAVAVQEDQVEETMQRMAAEEGLLIGPETAAAMAAVVGLRDSGTIRRGESVLVFATGHPANYV
ncbi:MAG: threonine synthase [Acidobacteriota bacterium]|nr:threonine synthase [Acidobacteriota bacterium]MDE3265798.1 threonine synthase [Acidobacteriota bacterium]